MADKNYVLTLTDSTTHKFGAKNRDAAIERTRAILHIDGEELSVVDFKRKGGKELRCGKLRVFP